MPAPITVETVSIDASNAEDMAMINTAPVSTQATVAVPDPDLKWIEFELALGTTDLPQQGFEGCVRSACAETSIAFLFDLPVLDAGHAQRVAAVASPTGDGKAAPDVRFIALSADGSKMKLEIDCPHLKHAEAVAHAYADLILQ